MRFNAYLATCAADSMSAYKTALKFDPCHRDEFSKLVACFDGSPLQATVLKHWMWTVQRSVFHGTAKYHPLMLIFVSKTQGLGKSTLLSKLVAPIKPMVMSTNVESLTDSRCHADLARHYVAVLDEIAKLERADINELKRVITMDTTSVREMYTTNVKTYQNHASFIGSSNRKIIESVYDNTGMRRFFEIEVDKAIDFSALDALDMFAVWHSIDENLPRGYIDPILPEIRQTQEKYMEAEAFDEFITFYKIKPDATDHFVGSTELYDVYLKWCSEKRYSPLEHKPFARKLTASNVTRKHTRTGNQYGINSDSSIFTEISTC
jgi:phage/plasmid-associated DNA primase